MAELPFLINEASAAAVPLVISIPHCGTDFPEELKEDYLESQKSYLDDTDWFLQELNDFAPAMGITVVYAKFSRWVIDLNRDPQSAPLYNDGRLITGLCTTTDFIGNPIYRVGKEPDQAGIQRRLDTYFWPYYQKVESYLQARKAEFGQVLLWDAHSIRSLVPTIRKEPFPQMILGDNDEKSASKKLIDVTLQNLRSVYEVNHNDPFKGGHITRYFGKPQNQVHALQLERNKNLYMDDTERKFDAIRAAKMREVLKRNFSEMIELLLREKL